MQAGAAEFLGASQTHLVPWNTLPPVNAKAFHHLPTRQSLIIGSPLRPHIPHLLPIHLSKGPPADFLSFLLNPSTQAPVISLSQHHGHTVIPDDLCMLDLDLAVPSGRDIGPLVLVRSMRIICGWDTDFHSVH